MNKKPFHRYYLLCSLGVLIASYYPLSMGVRVITDMLVNGAVMKENYPKYIIPYTPISTAIIIGVLLMPLCIRFFKKHAFAGGTLSAVAVFFGMEWLFEQQVVVSAAETVTKLEDWQMFMCYAPPEGWRATVTTYKTQTAADILTGDYNPAFKLHFYVISVVLIVTVLNCLYGFGQMIRSGDKKRCRSLVLQSVCSAVFLGLCILACFTAFWRDGSIQVSSLSASLMTLFFILLGVTAGVFIGSFLLGKRKLVSIGIPAVSASAMTLLMYIGEMILLNGHVYRLGHGWLFDGLPPTVLAPIDWLVIAASGVITALVFALITVGRDRNEKRLKIILSAICAVVILIITPAIALGGSSETVSVPQSDDANELDTSFACVQLLETTSDATASLYKVGGYVNGTDFSSMGQALKSKLKQERKTYSCMTEEQRLASSKLWGYVGMQVDTWKECEEAIGFAADNPLESIEWLDKVSYFGTESADTADASKHILISARSTFREDDAVSDIHMTAGYRVDDVKITLTAAYYADDSPCQTVRIYHGYADFTEETTTTAFGLPVLMITTDKSNNNGYYNDDYDDLTAYWIKENGFYSLRVLGDKEKATAILHRLLEEIS